MARFSALLAACLLAVVAVGMMVGESSAQQPDVYRACGPDETRITAAELPRVLDQERCPVQKRVIWDNGVGAMLPEPGEAVHTSASGPGGSQQLMVSNPEDGTIVLGSVGSESTDEIEGGSATLRDSDGRSSRSSSCRDSAYNSWDSRLYADHGWYFNRASTPGGMSRRAVADAIRRAGSNVSKVRDGCGVRDGVGPGLRYRGKLNRSVNMNTSGGCGANDHKSVVGFGNLPSSYTAKTCVWSWVRSGPNEINAADIRINKGDYNWTTRVTPRCRGRYDVQSSVTHERGHTFGLGDVSESSHGSLTMSEKSEGACQTSERSLGLGDARGLNAKYP